VRKNSVIPDSRQIQLFSDIEDNQPVQPLPLQIASDYNFPLQYHQTPDDVIVYSIQDWIAGVGQAAEPRDFWAKLKKRLKTVNPQLWTSCLQLPYIASNGKSYKMDFADDVTLYRITQQMSTNTGIRNEVLSFLAKAGAFVDELRQDPEAAQQKIASHRQAQALKAGRDASWIATREIGVMTRNQFTAALVNANPQINIGEATNTVYKSVLGQDASGLRKTLNIGQKQNPRDSMSELALAYLNTAEAAIRAQLSGFKADDVLPLHIMRSIIAIVAQATGTQAEQMARLVGIDLVSGRKMLGGGQ
jgi:hypothetical protein